MAMAYLESESIMMLLLYVLLQLCVQNLIKLIYSSV